MLVTFTGCEQSIRWGVVLPTPTLTPVFPQPMIFREAMWTKLQYPIGIERQPAYILVLVIIYKV
jgi:hypothetical protein